MTSSLRLSLLSLGLAGCSLVYDTGRLSDGQPDAALDARRDVASDVASDVDANADTGADIESDSDAADGGCVAPAIVSSVELKGWPARGSATLESTATCAGSLPIMEGGVEIGRADWEEGSMEASLVYAGRRRAFFDDDAERNVEIGGAVTLSLLTSVEIFVRPGEFDSESEGDRPPALDIADDGRVVFYHQPTMNPDEGAITLWNNDASTEPATSIADITPGDLNHGYQPRISDDGELVVWTNLDSSMGLPSVHWHYLRRGNTASVLPLGDLDPGRLHFDLRNEDAENYVFLLREGDNPRDADMSSGKMSVSDLQMSNDVPMLPIEGPPQPLSAPLLGDDVTIGYRSAEGAVRMSFGGGNWTVDGTPDPDVGPQSRVAPVSAGLAFVGTCSTRGDLALCVSGWSDAPPVSFDTLLSASDDGRYFLLFDSTSSDDAYGVAQSEAASSIRLETLNHDGEVVLPTRGNPNGAALSPNGDWAAFAVLGAGGRFTVHRVRISPEPVLEE